jgi:hypothetical protein
MSLYCIINVKIICLSCFSTLLKAGSYVLFKQAMQHYLEAKLWIEKTNNLVDIETDISRNLKSLVAIEIATAVRKKSLVAVETAIWFFETQPRWERELDR